MGLFKAFAGALSSTMADQWKDYIYCDSLSSDVVMKKGQRRTKNTNNQGNENVISSGSLIVINEGQCAIIVEDGQILEFVAEVGGFKFDSTTSPSIFEGSLGQGVKSAFGIFKKRFAQGGDVNQDQRVYYFNLKELSGHKFGSAQSLSYDDPIYKSISVRFFGSASLKLTDPISFYKNVCGNESNEFRFSKYWEAQLKEEFVMYLGQAIAMLSLEGVKYSQIPIKQLDLAKYMNQVVDDDWNRDRGFSVFSVAIPSITLDPADKARIDKFDEAMMMSDPANAAGRLVAAQANALENASSNTNGAVNSFMGIGMVQGAGGGINAGDLFKMNQQQQPQQPLNTNGGLTSWNCPCGEKPTGKFCGTCGSTKPEEPTQWVCGCGVKVTGNFCGSCGTKKPVPPSEWNCGCGLKVTGKFCGSCGTPQPLS